MLQSSERKKIQFQKFDQNKLQFNSNERFQSQLHERPNREKSLRKKNVFTLLNKHFSHVLES